MKSIAFPKMFNTNSTNTVKDLDATKQNTLLLLRSEKGDLFGDPYFGIRLKRYLYDQNNYILKDVIIDEIYTQIALFLPQVRVERKDIHIWQDMAKLYCKFKGVNQANLQEESYALQLYDEENK